MMAETEPSSIHKVAELYRKLSSEDTDAYFVHSVIKSTLTLMVVVPVMKISEAFFFLCNSILFNSILKIPSRPLVIVNRPVTEVVVDFSDAAIVCFYAVTVLFGLLNLVIKGGKELCKQIRDKQ